eukprot:7383489-Prymnesium_polylepis.1
MGGLVMTPAKDGFTPCHSTATTPQDFGARAAANDALPCAVRVSDGWRLGRSRACMLVHVDRPQQQKQFSARLSPRASLVNTIIDQLSCHHPVRVRSVESARLGPLIV